MFYVVLNRSLMFDAASDFQCFNKASIMRPKAPIIEHIIYFKLIQESFSF